MMQYTTVRYVLRHWLYIHVIRLVYAQIVFILAEFIPMCVCFEALMYLIAAD
jgi:hypothetical protein